MNVRPNPHNRQVAKFIMCVQAVCKLREHTLNDHHCGCDDMRKCSSVIVSYRCQRQAQTLLKPFSHTRNITSPQRQSNFERFFAPNRNSSSISLTVLEVPIRFTNERKPLTDGRDTSTRRSRVWAVNTLDLSRISTTCPSDLPERELGRELNL